MLTHSLVVASKVKEFDENYKVSEKFNEKFTQFYTFAVQIDEKYAITPTAGRIITASTEVTHSLTFTHSLTHLLTRSLICLLPPFCRPSRVRIIVQLNMNKKEKLLINQQNL